MNELQVLPIVKVDARYGPLGGKYPERVRIAMADGTTQWYVKEIQQPQPSCMAAIENVRAMKAVIGCQSNKTTPENPEEAK